KPATLPASVPGTPSTPSVNPQRVQGRSNPWLTSGSPSVVLDRNPAGISLPGSVPLVATAGAGTVSSPAAQPAGLAGAPVLQVFNSGSDVIYSGNVIVPTGTTGVLENDGTGTVVLTGTLTKNASVLVLRGGTFDVNGPILGPS